MCSIYKRNIFIRIFPTLMFILLFTLDISIVYSDNEMKESPVKNIVGDKVASDNIFDNASSKWSEYSPAIIIGEGVYYTREGDYYIAKPLPEVGFKCIVILDSEIETEDFNYYYYYVEGDGGFSGWVSDDFIVVGSFTGEVNADLLTVRSEPDKNSQVIGKLKKGDVVDIHKRTQETDTIDNINGYWVFIETPYDQTQGWVFEPYLTILIPYDYLTLLNDTYNYPSFVDINIVESIISAPERPLESYFKGLTYQSQALYLGCYRLLNLSSDSDDSEVISKVLEWSTLLETRYIDYNVTDFAYISSNPSAPEGARFKIQAYRKLKDRACYENAVISAFRNYGMIKYEEFESNSYYGIKYIRQVFDDCDVWGAEYTANLLDKLAYETNNGLLASFALLSEGRILSKEPNKKDKSFSIFKQVVDKYPEEEHIFYFRYTSNFAQYALLEAVQLIESEEERKSFLEEYAKVDVPLPIRYRALSILSYGDEKYQKIFESIELPEGKCYDFEM